MVCAKCKSESPEGLKLISSTARESSDRRRSRLRAAFGERSWRPPNLPSFVGTVGANRYQPISLDELGRNSENRCGTGVWSGIPHVLPKRRESVIYVSGTICHLCVGSLTQLIQIFRGDPIV
jgi:hypothetical protein